MAAIPGLDFPMYVYKPRRGMKRGEESKDTYKLPHRLIEKKRRDRINECIAQLKDLLPEHLKLSTLGHLEKAVVLELTLKHVKALTNLLEQQQQQIVSLQSGHQIGDYKSEGVENGEEMFRSGFRLCAREVLQHVARRDDARALSPARTVDHPSEVAPDPPRPAIPPRARPAPEARSRNCVPVIRRTFPPSGEQSGSDTDTDSGYGGEHDKDRSERARGVKEEWDAPDAKRPRVDGGGGEARGGHGGFSPRDPPAPLCMPFYVLPSMAAAAYLPVLEKCWYPGGVPVLYPGMAGHAALSPGKLPPSLIMTPGGGSPAGHRSPAMHHALKHVPPLDMETRD